MNIFIRIGALLLLMGALCFFYLKRPGAAPQPQAGTATPPPAAGEDAGPDLSTPKGVALAFANAVAAGDEDAMSKLVIGNGTHSYAYYAGVAEVVSAEHVFEMALKSRFGDSCELPREIESLGHLPTMPANFDELKEEIDGDKASLADASGHVGVRLKKVDGAWKVDFYAADAASEPGETEDKDKAREQIAAARKGFDQVSTKLIEGKYTDCKTAIDAVKEAIGPMVKAYFGAGILSVPVTAG
ncbi:MAG TPA: hypothetical protein VG733_01985 [Chthoniobacteraceae bacterium]|nr:hypothetical protein [Chthoniobacteraceae bacterium]